MYQDRLASYKRIEKIRGSKLIAYVTGDRQNMETQIHPEVLDFFVDHLDLINKVPKISLFLYTRGGVTLTGWAIVNLIRQFCDDFEVIVPSKALSTGTLICLGANRIVMTKQAALGPIDPSVNTPLNPPIVGAPPGAKTPVSVEAVRGYLEMAKKELELSSEELLSCVLMKLSDNVHPLVLGDAFRATKQIQMLANRLISRQVQDPEQVKKIIDFLCSDSGSHDYTINRTEAREMGLNIERPTEALYREIKKIYNDIREEFELNLAFNTPFLLGEAEQQAYQCKRGCVESVKGGSFKFISEGTIKKVVLPPNMGGGQGVNDQRTFEGWRRD